MSEFGGKINWILTKFADCVLASIMWAVFCIPVVTIGASTAALYGTVHSVIRHDRDTTANCFIRIFKTYFKKATQVWLILLLGIGVSAICWLLTYGAMKQGNELGVYNKLFFIPIIYILALCEYIFPYVVRFQAGVKTILKTSATLAVINLHWTILMFLLPVAAVFLIVALPVCMFFAPALVWVVNERILEKIFRSIMRPEDLEKELEREEQERLNNDQPM